MKKRLKYVHETNSQPYCTNINDMIIYFCSPIVNRFFMQNKTRMTINKNTAAARTARKQLKMMMFHKMVMFRDQVGAFVTSREIASLLRFYFYALEVYVVQWFEGLIQSYAPANYPISLRISSGNTTTQSKNHATRSWGTISGS